MQHTGPLSSANLKLLQGVSRSFYLSIRLLPRALRAPIAVGYLLARATDTVADTTALPQAERQRLLSELLAAIEAPVGQSLPKAADLAAFAERQTDPHERALMQALPACLALLHTLSDADQASVRLVLRPIGQGQLLDVARFGHGPASLATEAELEDYTWLVAGCVGEFWTDLCERHLPGWAAQPAPAMRALGRRYGMGLQRLNILRDAGKDLADGRCYLPDNRLLPLGLSGPALARAVHSGDNATLARLAPLWQAMLQETRALLADGLHYSLALNSRRLRLASALPALIGARTLALLEAAGPEALLRPVKMPRREVRALLWRWLLQGLSRAALQREFVRLAGPSAA
jgi:farnesyl-diphosphate farnesyltransferase